MLIEREQHVGDLEALLAESAAGRGRLVFVGGEAGVGKTALVTSFVRSVPPEVVVRRGTCDNVTTADPLGPLVEALPEIADNLPEQASPSRLSLFRRIRDLLSAQPTVLLLEDVHWADEATLELLRYLGRRLDDRPLLIVATFRDDEVGPEHALTLVLGDLATSATSVRLSLPTLSVEGVRTLTRAVDSPVDHTELHARTGGNPFYVTEALATGDDSVPSTVRAAVLARVARLSSPARHVLSTVAVLGHRPDQGLVVAVAGETLTSLDECLRAGMLIADDDAVAFRHELARMAVRDATTRATAAMLHGRALTELRQRGSHDDRRLAYHAAGCGDRVAATEHARLAGDHAARLGAHREAAEHYRTALRWHTAPADLVPLLDRLSYECYLTDELDEAVDCRQRLLELHEQAGDARATGDTQRWMSRLLWFLGRNAESEAYAARAIDVLQPLGDSRELAMAYSNMAQLRMLAGDSEPAIAWAGRALQLADALGDRDIRTHALNNLGTAMVFGGEALEGTTRVAQSLELALAADAEEHAARAYTNLGSTRVSRRALMEADSGLRDGIAYCSERDLDSWRLYMTAWLARCTAELGRVAEAAEHAATVVQSPRVSAVALMPALVVAGRTSVWSGGDGRAELDRALDLAVATGESQRLVPVACARAEAAWIAGRTADVVAAVDVAWDVAVRHPFAWDVAELAWWLHVAGQPRPSPVPLPRPFALLVDEEHALAAQEWQSLGCPVWAAHALCRSDDVEDAREGVRLVEAIGAVAVRDALLRDRHARGQAVPRGPRGASRGHAAGLTPRECDVLELLADGLSNAEIASCLFLSERTVSHHVSAVLRKIGEPTRSRAVASARRRGLLPGRGPAA